MAKIKKNALANIVFPMVDSTDFASIESAITASDFNSGATKKFYGVNHGGSAAFTSGSISKAATLVRSGIFQQTLKATETNYDYVMYRFVKTGCADQLLVFETATYDDSDMFSQMSDIGSNVLSAITVNYNLISDVDSQVNLLATSAGLSDAQSNLLSYLAGMSGAISNVDSQVLLNASVISDVYSLLSDHHSDFQSRVTGTLATSAGLSNTESNLLSYLAGMSDAISNVQSTVDSQFVWNSAFLSDMNSDLSSQIGAIAVTVTASDMSDIASRVWATTEGTRVDSRILVLQSMVSDVDSQVLLNASMISDTLSALDSQFVWTSAFLSDMNSDLSSQIGGVTASVGASDMSDIASRVWATTEGTRVDSRILVLQSLVSDVDSQVNLLATSDYLSGLHSDLTSQIGGIAATVTASDMSDIASRVGVVLASDLSDILSSAQEGSSRALVIQSMVSDVDSQLQLVATSDYLSAVHSDIMSGLGGISVVLTASDISDIASAVTAAGVEITDSDMSDIVSRVWAAKYTAHSAASSFGSLFSDVYSLALATQSLVSDVDSQVLLNASMISDVQSALDSQFVWTSNTLSDIQSDLSSQIGGITAGVTASDMSDISSRVAVVLASDLSDILSAAQEGSSRTLVVQSMVSDVESAVDALNDPTAGAIADAVWDEPYSDHLAASTVGSRLQNVASSISDVDSALTVHDTAVSAAISDLDSQVNLNYDITSDVQSQLDVTHSLASDIDSQLTVTHSLLSDVESAVDSIWTTALTESYNADGAAPTAAQALFGILQNLTEFSINSTTITVKKLDGSTSAMTFTLDDGTNPTSRTRAT